MDPSALEDRACVAPASCNHCTTSLLFGDTNCGDPDGYGGIDDYGSTNDFGGPDDATPAMNALGLRIQRLRLWGSSNFDDCGDLMTATPMTMSTPTTATTMSIMAT